MNSQAQQTEFYLPVSSNGYSAQLLSFSAEKQSLFATIEVSPEVWDAINMVMLFNLTWDNRSEGSVSGTKPVQLKLAFDKALYQNLKDSNSLLDEQAFIAAGKESPMKNTKNWYALSVTEAVDLPKHLQAKGEVREGFTTDWLAEFE